MRSATNNNRWSATLYTISIHALHAECDDTLIFAQHLRSTISIHALHAECDLVWEILATVPETNFNPRTPCGVRPRCWLPKDYGVRYFNPRTPCGVRHEKEGEINGFRRRFQSTHSMRSATATNGYRVWNGVISIHALHAECDQSAHEGRWRYKYFNPRTPCGVRQVLTMHSILPVRFQSTHSMRSATPCRIWTQGHIWFQSTHSMRSATPPDGGDNDGD